MRLNGQSAPALSQAMRQHTVAARRRDLGEPARCRSRTYERPCRTRRRSMPVSSPCCCTTTAPGRHRPPSTRPLPPGSPHQTMHRDQRAVRGRRRRVRLDRENTVALRQRLGELEVARQHDVEIDDEERRLEAPPRGTPEGARHGHRLRHPCSLRAVRRPLVPFPSGRPMRTSTPGE